MHPATGPAWLVWLETSGFAVAMRQWLWLYPIVEIVHIVGFVAPGRLGLHVRPAAAGPRARPAGERDGRPPAALVARGPAAGGADRRADVRRPRHRDGGQPRLPAEDRADRRRPPQRGLFHRFPFRAVGDWDTEIAAPLPARLAGALSLLLWTSVIACGRLLAYF